MEIKFNDKTTKDIRTACVVTIDIIDDCIICFNEDEVT